LTDLLHSVANKIYPDLADYFPRFPTMVPRLKSTKIPRLKSTKGTKAQKHDGSKAQKHNGSKAQKHSGSKTQNHEGSKAQKREKRLALKGHGLSHAATSTDHRPALAAGGTFTS
jgi:hypothetical protein